MKLTLLLIAILLLALLMTGCVRIELQEFRIERELEWPAPYEPPTRA